MSRFMRLMGAGVSGLLIVLGLFMLMDRLLRQETPQAALLPTVELATTEVHRDPVMPRPIIAVEKPRRTLPEQQPVPGLELTDDGEHEAGSTAWTSSLSQQASSVIAGVSAVAGPEGDGFANQTLDTSGMVKYYEHSLKFPKAARTAGILKGELLVRAVFDPNHRFLRFEILTESHPELFRGVLYQLKFVANHHHLFHPMFNVDKGPVKPASGEHSDAYRFVFDWYDAEQIRLYVARDRVN